MKMIRGVCLLGLLLPPLLQSCSCSTSPDRISSTPSSPHSPVAPTATQSPATPAHKPTAIIFVHGIHGDEKGTWTSDTTHAYFPDLVRGDPSVTDAEVFTVNYPTPFSGNHNDVPDISRTLMENLRGISETHGRVIFICHSLGGLIVKELLLDNPELSKQVPFVIFYGTPNTGSFIASFASVFNGDPLLKSMSNTGNDKYLLSLESRWQDKHYYEHIHRYCAYESEQMKPNDLRSIVVHGTPDAALKLLPSVPGIFVVDAFSATYGCEPDSLSNHVAANHINISKPNSRDDDSYKIFKRYYDANGVIVAQVPSAPIVFEKVLCAFYGEANQGGNAWNRDEACPISDFALLDPNYKQRPENFTPQHYINSTMTVGSIPPGIEVQTDGGYHWGILGGFLDNAANTFHIRPYCEPSGGSEGGCNIKVKIIGHFRVQPSSIAEASKRTP